MKKRFDDSLNFHFTHSALIHPIYLEKPLIQRRVLAATKRINMGSFRWWMDGTTSATAAAKKNWRRGGARMKQDEMNYVAPSFNITSWWFSLLSFSLLIIESYRMSELTSSFLGFYYYYSRVWRVKCLNRRIKVNRLGCYLVWGVILWWFNRSFEVRVDFLKHL